MDQTSRLNNLEEAKNRIRERLKKLDEINNSLKNVYNKKQSDTVSSQYEQLIAERLSNIERIRNDIINKKSGFEKNSEVEQNINQPQKLNNEPTLEVEEIKIIPTELVTPKNNSNIDDSSNKFIPEQSKENEIDKLKKYHSKIRRENPSITYPIHNKPESQPSVTTPPHQIQTDQPSQVIKRTREQRVRDREQRMRESASSGCGCRKAK